MPYRRGEIRDPIRRNASRYFLKRYLVKKYLVKRYPPLIRSKEINFGSGAGDYFSGLGECTLALGHSNRCRY